MPDLSVQTFNALSEQRLAEHYKRWRNRLPEFKSAAFDDLSEYIATYFATVLAEMI